MNYTVVLEDGHVWVAHGQRALDELKEECGVISITPGVTRSDHRHCYELGQCCGPCLLAAAEEGL